MMRNNEKGHSAERMKAYSVINTNKSEQTGILWPELLVIAGVMLVQLKGSILTDLTLMGLCVWALRDPKHAIQALCLSWFIGFLNPGIFIDLKITTILRWLIMLAAFGRVIFSMIHRRRRIPWVIIQLLLFSLVALFSSIYKSYAPIVSLFKLGIFTFGVATILLAFELTADQRAYWKSWFTTFFLLILICGFPFYFSDLGYFKNGRGFQGLLSHPQAYAVFLAPMISWLTWRFLFEKNHSFPVIIGLALGWLSLIASKSRTGMLSAVIGFSLAIIIGGIIKRKWRSVLKRTVGSYLFISCFCLVGILIALKGSILLQHTVKFIKKDNPESKFAELYNRGLLIEKSINNFVKNPLLGIGFGIASDRSKFHIVTDEWLGIPVSASQEKGVLPTATIEEVGIVGAGFLLVFIFFLIRPILNQSSFAAFCIILTCLVINMGEMVFFSFGGMGLYTWLLIGLSRVLRE